MTLLFDIHDSEGDGKKKSRKRPKAEVTVEAAVSHVPKSYGVAAVRILGKIDHNYDCADAACGTQCHDLMLEERGEWYLVCAFCGTGQLVPALEIEPEVEEKPAEDVFRLPDGGRFSGLTLAEVGRLEDGPAYIAWSAKSHKHQAVRDACRTHLDQVSQSK